MKVKTVDAFDNKVGCQKQKTSFIAYIHLFIIQRKAINYFQDYELDRGVIWGIGDVLASIYSTSHVINPIQQSSREQQSRAKSHKVWGLLTKRDGDVSIQLQAVDLLRQEDQLLSLWISPRGMSAVMMRVRSLELDCTNPYHQHSNHLQISYGYFFERVTGGMKFNFSRFSCSELIPRFLATRIRYHIAILKVFTLPEM